MTEFIKKRLSLLLAVLLVFNGVPLNVAAEEDTSEETEKVLDVVSETVSVSDEAASENVIGSGTCGENLKWELTADGLMTISVSGEMDDWSYDNKNPWYDIREEIFKVIIEEGITTVGERAFEECCNLVSVDLPEGIISINFWAFYDCVNLKEVNFPETLENLEGCAFYNCSSLNSISFSENTSYIGAEAFYNCSSLTEIRLPLKITSVENETFYGCGSLKEIELPHGITVIGYSAFYNCSNLQTINLPDTITEIGWGAFYNCKKLESVLNLPEGMTEIPFSVFQNCEKLTKIHIPSEVTRIDNWAFEGCSSLADFEMPDQLTSIGEDAFSGCSSLTVIDIPKTVETIGEGAFVGCRQLKEFRVDKDNSAYCSVDGVLYTKDRSNLITYPNQKGSVFTIPDTVTEISYAAFLACDNLVKVEIPETVVTLGRGVFQKCSSLKEAELSETMDSTGYYTFADCDSLTDVRLHSGITTITSCSFKNSRGLEEITIPENVSVVGISAFRNCSGLKRIVFTGNAPEFPDTEENYYTIFRGVTADAYYPADNETWTEDVFQNYGGTLTWIPYDETLKITSQPSDYTGKAGDTASFTVEASGENLTYQWQYQNVGSSAWKTSGQSGNKTGTLCVPITESRNGQKYRCVITDGSGKQVISNEAVLYVEKQAEELKITSQPADYTGEVGETAVFVVEATGEDLSYQWQYQNAGARVWKASGQSGNKTNTLSVPITETRDGQKYRCVVTDGTGDQVISDAAALHVGSTSGTEEVTITGQPKDYTGEAGTAAVFTVEAAGTGLSYQWQYQNVGTSVWKASGQSGNKTNTLSVPITEARDGQKYRCVVTDGSGNQATSDAATLHVGSASGSEGVTITGQPEDYTGAVGETAVFTVTAEGESLSYQWQYQNAGTGVWRASGQSGNKTNTLSVPITAARNGQKYRCVVTDGNGNSMTSDAAVLYVTD